MASGDEIWSPVAARRALRSGERKGKKLAGETWSSETWQRLLRDNWTVKIRRRPVTVCTSSNSVIAMSTVQ